MTTKHLPICSSLHFQTIWHNIRTLTQFLRLSYHVLDSYVMLLLVQLYMRHDVVISMLSLLTFDQNVAKLRSLLLLLLGLLTLANPLFSPMLNTRGSADHCTTLWKSPMWQRFV